MRRPRRPDGLLRATGHQHGQRHDRDRGWHGDGQRVYARGVWDDGDVYGCQFGGERDGDEQWCGGAYGWSCEGGRRDGGGRGCLGVGTAVVTGC
jgi:hypothetical protein